jgi:hypothetical protein
MEKPTARGVLGDGLGIGHLYFDDEHKLLFVAGRGESSIEYYQYSSSNPNGITRNDKIAVPNSTKAFCILPKQTCSSETNEVDRFARIDNKGDLCYISLNKASRTQQFSDAVYTEFNSPTPANDFE